MRKITVMIYVEDGKIFERDVDNVELAKELCMTVLQTGFKYNDGVTFECYPVHKILKTKIDEAVPTACPDRTKVVETKEDHAN